MSIQYSLTVDLRLRVVPPLTLIQHWENMFDTVEFNFADEEGNIEETLRTSHLAVWVIPMVYAKVNNCIQILINAIISIIYCFVKLLRLNLFSNLKWILIESLYQHCSVAKYKWFTLWEQYISIPIYLYPSLELNSIE